MGYESPKKVSKKVRNAGKIRTKIVASFLMALHPIRDKWSFLWFQAELKESAGRVAARDSARGWGNS